MDSFFTIKVVPDTYLGSLFMSDNTKKGKLDQAGQVLTTVATVATAVVGVIKAINDAKGKK